MSKTSTQREGMAQPTSASPGRGASARDPDSGRFEQALRRARRHSSRVRALKIGLPALAVLMGLGFVGYSYFALPQGVAVDLGGTALEGGKLVMSNPKLDGFTRENRPYSMRAARAIQDVGNTDLIELEEIDARLPVDSSQWAEIDAARGFFDRQANTLELTEGMTVRMENGMTAVFRSAMVDIANGSLSSSDPINIEMDGSRIAADSMRVTDRGTVLIFENRVRMEIDGERISTVARSAGANDAQ